MPVCVTSPRSVFWKTTSFFGRGILWRQCATSLFESVPAPLFSPILLTFSCLKCWRDNYSWTGQELSRSVESPCSSSFLLMILFTFLFSRSRRPDFCLHISGFSFHSSIRKNNKTWSNHWPLLLVSMRFIYRLYRLYLNFSSFSP